MLDCIPDGGDDAPICEFCDRILWPWQARHGEAHLSCAEAYLNARPDDDAHVWDWIAQNPTE